MAALAPAQASCVIQLQLADILGRNNPVNREIEKQGFTQALRSPQNTSGFAQVPVQSNGSRPLDTSKRKVQVRYRASNCDVVSSGSLSCTDEDNEEGDPYEYADVEVKYYKKSKQVKLSRTAFADLCSGLDTEYTMRVAELASDIVRQRNKDLIADYIAALNNYADGTSSVPGTAEKTISLFSSTAVPQPMGLMPLLNEYFAKGYAGEEPIAVGGYQLNSWMQAQGLYAGNLDGADINKFGLSSSNMFLDNVQDAIVNLGDQHLFTWIAGQIQYLEWLTYAPETGLARNTEEITKDVITIGGERFDILINDSACGDFVNIQLAKGYGLYIPPADAFAGTCTGEETKLSWILDCGALACDTVQGTVAPVVE
jgi:hypothetical protein